MTPQELKECLLWNAIQGKITTQTSDESVDKVIGMLQLSSIAEEEHYFDIPTNWKWVKIGDIFDLVNGKAFKPSDWSDTGIPIVRIQNLNDNTAPYNYCSTPCESKYYIHGGELLFSWSGTPGTSFGAFIWNGGEAVLNQHIFIVYPKIQADTMYLMHALNAELRIFIEKAHGGAGLKHITRKEFDACLLPIPPLAEQKRIVAKIEELLPLIDRYEKAWSRLEEFNKRFPDDLQKSILQMAIQGKLVEQRPEEGTGEELYVDIKRRKTIIESTGVLKGRKKKELIPIDENDTPFDIPSSWRWIRLGEVSEIFGRIGFRGYTKNDIVDKGKGAITISPSNLLPNGCTDFSECTYISWEKYEESPEIKIYEDDILIVKTGSSYGKCCLVKSLPEKATINPQLAVLKYTLCDCPYLAYALSSPMARKQFEAFVIGTSIPTFSQEKLSNLLIPLPPLAEQRRIVARLNELLPLCNKLKTITD